MRILFLNQTFSPDVVASAQYASDLAATLAERGHEVTVLCSRRGYDNPRVRYPRYEVWKGVTIRRISCLGLGKKTRWRRAADFGSFMANCARHLVMLRRVDVVVGMTSPPLISWLGSLFARVKGGRFVFWVMDLNPDEALAAGWLRPGSVTTRVLQWLLLDSLHGSTRVIALDRFMAKLIEEKGIDPTRIVVLPPWSHDHALRYDLAGRDRFRRAHGLEGKFVVMYAGNHTPCHPLATLLDAARALSSHPDIAFCFVGGGSELQTVRKFANDYRLSNIVVMGYQPLEMLSAALSAADLHTVVMGNQFVGIVHPSKVYNIRALGIPYLYIGPLESHITDLEPAFSAQHGDVDGVSRHIQAAADDLSQSSSLRPPVLTRSYLLGQVISVLEDAAGAETAVLSGAPCSHS